MEKTVRIIRKSQREEIRVALKAYQGHDLVDVRISIVSRAGPSV